MNFMWIECILVTLQERPLITRYLYHTENSKSFSLHTIALTGEAKLWKDTAPCPNHSAVNSAKGANGTKKTKGQYSQ